MVASVSSPCSSLKALLLARATVRCRETGEEKPLNAVAGELVAVMKSPPPGGCFPLIAVDDHGGKNDEVERC